MKKETGERLVEYRKANGYSQEELAARIGVSRQAISKWERGESSPDTDNLIALAELYGITIDTLINGGDVKAQAEDKKESEPEKEEQKPQTEVSFKNGIHVHNGKDNVDIDFKGIHVETDNGEKVHIGKGYGVQVEGVDDDHIFKNGKPKFTLIGTVTPIVIIVAYLVLGFVYDWGWRLGWLLLFLIPIIESLVTAIQYRSPDKFAYPFLAIGAYLAYGMIYGVWHPTWIVFLTIPLYYLIADAFKQKKTKEKDLG